MATAPHLRARSPLGSRRRAAAAVVGCTVALTLLAGFAWKHRIDRSRFDADPVKLPAPVWRSLLTSAITTERACPPSVPVAALYVSRACQHCQAELRRWAEMVRTNHPAIHCVGLVIVARPGTNPISTEWVPSELSRMLLWDHDADIAGALGARFVPLASFISSQGVELSRVVGEESETAFADHLVVLRRRSGVHGGTH